MALEATNLLIQLAPIPATFVGTPQDLAATMVKRMRIVSPTGISFIFTGDAEPLTDVGPWLKNGTQWWVFDDETKRYVPLDISASETIWFQVGSNVPTTTNPPVWLRTTANPTEAQPQFGTPVGWYLYDGTQWVGFTELVNGQVTLLKMADGVRGALITYDDSNKPVLLAPGTAGQFLISDGDDVIWSDLPDTSLDGKLSPQILGPITDSAYVNTLQAVTFSLDVPREALIYAYANVNLPVTSNSSDTITLTIDGVLKDTAYFASVQGAGTSNQTAMYTLINRMSLGAGNHTVSCATGGTAVFVDPALAGGVLPVKFMIHLL
jgi:hypothetical protein